MATDGMTVRLHLKRMKVLRVVTDEIDELVIEVADTRTVVRCPGCGHKTTKVHETRRVMVRDVPLGRPTTLVWLQRRFECDNCGERHTEDHPEIEGKLTRRLARELVRDAKYLTIRQLSPSLWASGGGMAAFEHIAAAAGWMSVLGLFVRPTTALDVAATLWFTRLTATIG